MTPAIFAYSTAAAQTSAIAGKVRENGSPVADAAVYARRSDRSIAREATTDGAGEFRLAALAAGIYTVTVRKVGYRSAEQPTVRVAEGQTVTLSVSLSQAPRQLSTIQVVTSPITVDASTPELSVQLSSTVAALLPSARDASSLIALVPGARKDQLWGGAPGVTNDYQLDGVSMNHPGVGGDFLSLSVDWIDALDVRGLGAGAEHGNFQGGIINAITKTGGNERRFALRTAYEAAALTATNLNTNEVGAEQYGRRELSGEALGPFARDRLFYFLGGQLVSRDLRSPDLNTETTFDYQRAREEHTDARAIAKLTWLPALGQRVDLLGGFTSSSVEHAGINGVDDPSATQRVRQPVGYYALAWTNAGAARSVIDVRVAGFTSRTVNSAYAGSGVPGVQLMQLGRMPSFQNATFDERREPSSINGTIQWRRTQSFVGAEHQLVLGSEVSRGRWRDFRTRNGGLTWRPYAAPSLDPFDAATWQTTGSDWGGEIRMDADVASEAAFAQDYIALGPRVTLTPGLRYGHWAGYIRPVCDSAASLQAGCYRFEAVQSSGWDPRIGVVWDVTGRNTLALKAHWGRYHQGMFALFFDRAIGANVYTDARFYYSAPALTDSRTTFTVGQRDAPGSAFGTSFEQRIMSEAGRVENYRQPYVDQGILGVEKSFGSRWKAELLYVNRRNGNIVGLLDKNLARNYSPIFDVSVDHRLAAGQVLDANGNRLVLPILYVANRDLVDVLSAIKASRTPGITVAGYDTSALRWLRWNPDVVLTTIPAAKRRYQQVTMLLRGFHESWRGEASLTGARLRGNVPGVTGFGTTGSRFSAGPFVRANEGINAFGSLPDALELEGKLWMTRRISRAMQAGVLYTHTLGERFAPTFDLLNRYSYKVDDNVLPDALLQQVIGQTVLVERRGARQYASREVVDFHWEWRGTPRATVLADLFNAFNSNALTSINTNIGDQIPSDPTSFFGAARLRVAPRSLRLGIRVE